MGTISKSCTLILMFMLVMSTLSLLAVKPANAQTGPSPSAVPIPQPSVPNFTIKFVNLSYDVPTTTSFDPYTGQNVTHEGYHVENRTIQVTIQNQPFTPQWVQYDSSTFIDSFYYNVRIKGHFTDNWTTLYNPDLGFPTQSNSSYTILSYSLDENNYPFWNEIAPGAQIDFQIQALIGSVHRGYNASATNQLEMFPWVFDGQTSDWSNTQTITIPASSTSPTSTPTVPELSWLIVVPLLLSMFCAAMIVRYQKTSDLSSRPFRSKHVPRK